jgi:hypothetical protein
MTLEQYEMLQEVLRVRDRVAFGYETGERDLAHAVGVLANLLPRAVAAAGAQGRVSLPPLPNAGRVVSTPGPR